jgi:hypothetical protein
MDLLDDNLDWDKLWADDDTMTATPRPVRMLQTFNTDEQAQLAAATLRGSGISAFVISAATSGLTPFAYGNFRLFVADSQAHEAAKLLTKRTIETSPSDASSKESHWLITLLLTLLVVAFLAMRFLGVTQKLGF